MAVLPASVFAVEVKADQPIHWWPMGGSNAVTAIDQVGGANADLENSGGTAAFGGTSLVYGDNTGSYTTSGGDGNSNDRLYVASLVNPISGSLPAFTIELVLQADSGITNTPSVFIQSGVGDGSFINVALTAGGKLNFVVGDTYAAGGSVTSIIGDDDLRDDAVKHVCCVYDGATVYAYVNGTLQADTSAFSLTLGTASDAAIGHSTVLTAIAQNQFVGLIDQAVVYDKALPTDRITAHFNAVFAPWNGDTTGARINRVLDAVGWSTSERDVDTGDSTLQSATITGQNALIHMQDVRDTEYGELFVTRDGKLRFVSRSNRWKPPYNTPIFTLSDDGTGQCYAEIKFNYDDQLIRNQVTIGYANGVSFTANSTSSQDSFYIQSYSKTGLLGDVDSESKDYANYLVGRYKDPLFRVQSIELNPRRDPATFFPQVLSADLVYQVRVMRTPQSLGSAIDINYVIEGVSHHITPKDWVTRLELSPADTPGAFILDSTSQGILDTNALGW